ncbi:MAG TPA: hypothetical protein ENJ61_00230 [Aquifex aeolicus]|uniref:Uncharacterized protein n=1 Tax=Aquifex aeolicus TaxID=63363 RepID=A0A7C5L1L7_AQUAO|nr:hypothetical protein [Aquifex aeolicus]
MWKTDVQPKLVPALKGRKPEVAEYGYQIFRIPLSYKGVYVERDLLCLSWEREVKGVRERKIRPIRVVSQEYYLIPHSRLEREMRDAGFEVSVFKTGTDFRAQGTLKDQEAYLLLRNSYRNGAFAVDIYVKVGEVYMPTFKDAIWYPHRATNGPLLTREALEETWNFAKTIPSVLPKLKREAVPLGYLEFVKSLKVVRREYENGSLKKEEVDPVGEALYRKLKKYGNLYDFVLHLIRETEPFPEKGYGYRRIRDRIERYTGTVIREVLRLREALERMKLKKSA